MHIKQFSKNILAFSVAISLICTLLWAIDIDDNPLSGWDFLVTRLATSLFVVYLIKKLGLWSMAGFRRNRFWYGILLGIPLIIMGFSSGIISNIEQFDSYSFLGIPNLLSFTVSMFFVGFAEEVVFRGLLLNNMMEKWGSTYGGVWKSIFVSAAIFGIVHLSNIFIAPIITVVVQAINAMSGGVLFSAIYIRTKNIWAVIAIHALTNWLALIIQVCFTGTSIISTQMSVPEAIVFTCVGSVVPLFFAWIYLGRKSKFRPII